MYNYLVRYNYAVGSIHIYVIIDVIYYSVIITIIAIIIIIAVI